MFSLDNPPEYLSTYEAVDLTEKLGEKIPHRTIYSWIEKKRLTAIKVGGRYIIPTRDLISVLYGRISSNNANIRKL